MKHIVGISIGGTKSAICYATFSGDKTITSIEKKVVVTDPNDPYKTMELVYEALDCFPQDYEFISVICGSPMDAEKGIIQAPSNLPGWIDFPICDLLKNRYHVNSNLLNDADASALAEYHFGAGKNKNYKNFIYLIVGTGFGSGIIINHKLYTGSTFNAGEIGYVKASDNGYMPRNKHPGTFEGFVSGGGMGDFANLYLLEHPEVESSLNKYPKGQVTAKDVFFEARNGDEVALMVVNQCATKLGEAISLYLNILNPDAIAIGGIYPRGIDLLKDKMFEVIEKNALVLNYNHADIVPSELNENIDDYSSLMGIYK